MRIIVEIEIYFPLVKPLTLNNRSVRRPDLVNQLGLNFRTLQKHLWPWWVVMRKDEKPAKPFSLIVYIHMLIIHEFGTV